MTDTTVMHSYRRALADVVRLSKECNQLRAELDEARELLTEMSTLLTTESQIGDRVKTFLQRTTPIR